MHPSRATSTVRPTSRFILLTFLLANLVRESSGQERFFYHGADFGSESILNPVNVLLNEGFDIIQIENFDRHVTSFHYRSDLKNVMRSLAHPVKTIKRYGFAQFVRSEMLPLSTKHGGGGQWLPNYQLHVIGGGMMFATLDEWYAANQVPNSKVASLLTVASYHLLNETVENHGFDDYNGDPVADLYFFDVAGVLLFTSVRVRRLFGERLHLRSWMLQPSLSPTFSYLYNVGQYFSLQWALPRTDRYSLFYLFGMNNLAGLSFHRRDGNTISLGVGLRSRKLIVVDPEIYRQTAELVPTAGLFLDRAHSLLASIVYSGMDDPVLNANLYPGILSLGPLDVGVWASTTRDGKPSLGFSTRWLPGFGGAI